MVEVLETDEQIVERYVKDIVDGKFEFEVADPNKGQTGSGIGDALRRLNYRFAISNGADIERHSKMVLLRYAVKEFWNDFKPMRFYLPNVWDTWEDYLRKRLF